MSFPILCAACRAADPRQAGIAHDGCQTAVREDRDCDCWCFDRSEVLW